uniref:hypothetical protein n=1 Tax=Pseudomonas sp. ESBL1 TaxID=3077324 RepID=UPI002FC5EAA3
MPTENRSSNTEMVSVPREWLNSVALLQMPLDQLQEQAVEFLCEPCDEPAEQHQGEPVGTLLIDEYFDGREVGDVDVQLDTKACEQLAEKYPGQSLPLYICPAPVVPGEVERLLEELEQFKVANARLSMSNVNRRNDNNALRAQLAEAHGLLRSLKNRPVHEWASGKIEDEIDAALSASAEPSAPKCTHRFMSLADSPRRCADCDAVEPSAPVERETSAPLPAIPVNLEEQVQMLNRSNTLLRWALKL